MEEKDIINGELYIFTKPARYRIPTNDELKTFREYFDE